MELIYYKSGIIVQKIPIEGDNDKVFPIGRVGGETLFTIEDSRISKTHAKLTYNKKENKFILEDLGSSNGTFLKNEKIDKIELPLGVPFYIGSQSIHKFIIQKERENNYQKISLTEAFQAKTKLIIGRTKGVEIYLDSPNISKLHAEIFLENGTYYIKDLGSTNGTYINTTKLSRKISFSEKDIIRIGNYELKKDGEFLVVDNFTNKDKPAIIINKVSKKVQSRTIMNNISLNIETSELVGIMGPSGCGKTTLLKILNGYDKDYAGEVYIHGLSLSQNFSILKSLIGYVPQEDTIHKDLTVRDALYYGCKLRLPSDISKKEIENRIDEVLKQLRISHIKKSFIKNISGGERKRVCIAMELLSDPSILFLDEPTSPLDPQSIKDFLEILQSIAALGKTIIMVTHKPEDLTFLQKVIFLAKGGSLAYYGDIHSYLSFFNVKDIINVYSLLTADKKWEFQSGNTSSYPPIGGASISTEVRIESFWKQFFILNRRMFKIKINDKLNTFLLLIQSPVIALLMAMIFDKTSLSSLFIIILSSIWFGCNNTARDIVSELPIYTRERRFNLRIDSYIGARITTSFFISVFQIFLFLIVINHFLKLDNFITMYFFLLFISLNSILLGLLLSATFDNTEKVMTIVPLTLIPQIMLSGVLEKIQSEFVEFISYFTIARWGMEGIAKIHAKVMIYNEISKKDISTTCKDLLGFREFHSMAGIIFALTLILIGSTLLLLKLMKRKDNV